MSLPIFKRLWNRIRLLSRWDNHETYFGRCPRCLREVPYMNIGRNHWFVCERDKVRWWAGSNLFSSWHDETEADWERNFETIKDFEDAKPYYPPATMGEMIGNLVRPTQQPEYSPIDDGAGVPF
ncbi:MAG: hypothetical protein EXS05_17695 [Planctomycetaceae bacterium]|nr:hypothetical protein [Planctomycetaceae bacterium]